MKQHYEYPDIDSTKVSDRVLSKKEVISKASLSKSTMYAYIQRGIFPAPINLGLRRVGWLESEVDDWLKRRTIRSRSGASNS